MSLQGTANSLPCLNAAPKDAQQRTKPKPSPQNPHPKHLRQVNKPSPLQLDPKAMCDLPDNTAASSACEAE